MRPTCLEHAEAFARTRHLGQFRRDGRTPYIKHVELVVEKTKMVAGRMRGLSSFEIEMAIIAAWLHDLVENGCATLDEIRALGTIPGEAVDALTIRPGESYEGAIARAKANPIAHPVKIADNLANLSDEPTERQIVRYAQSLLFLHEPNH